MITTRKPHCQCLHESENKLPRTKRCLITCRDYYEIMKGRKNDSKNENGENSTVELEK